MSRLTDAIDGVEAPEGVDLPNASVLSTDRHALEVMRAVLDGGGAAEDAVDVGLGTITAKLGPSVARVSLGVAGGAEGAPDEIGYRGHALVCSLAEPASRIVATGLAILDEIPLADRERRAVGRMAKRALLLARRRLEEAPGDPPPHADAAFVDRAASALESERAFDPASIDVEPASFNFCGAIDPAGRGFASAVFSPPGSEAGPLFIRRGGRVWALVAGGGPEAIVAGVLRLLEAGAGPEDVVRGSETDGLASPRFAALVDEVEGVVVASADDESGGALAFRAQSRPTPGSTSSQT